MSTISFITREEFVPSTDDRIPSYGIIARDNGVVVLVFDESTPVHCQEKVKAVAEECFLNCIGVTEHEISAFVSDKLHRFVNSDYIRRNEFTQKWVWLGKG